MDGGIATFGRTAIFIRISGISEDDEGEEETRNHTRKEKEDREVHFEFVYELRNCRNRRT